MNSYRATLRNITFKASQNDLIAIIGQVGSGKTSLLMALLCELERISGDLDVKGSVFYVSQEPWIFNDTIKQNILFDNVYNEMKYKEIIKVCCLEDDLKAFSNGDNEMIGEKGINLSGGQRARISLARALYSDAQIYLMDDPLSAVDANVANLLFKNAINGYLKLKLRILVTHHIQHLNDASQILVLNNGQIESLGTFNDLSKSMNIINYLETNNDDQHESNSPPPLPAPPPTNEPFFNSSVSINKIEFEKETLISPQILKINESRQTFNDIDYEDEDISANNNNNQRIEKHTFGSVSWRTYYNYFKMGAGGLGSIVLLIVFITSQFFIVYCDYWLSKWSSIEQKRKITNDNLNSQNITCLQNNHNQTLETCIKIDLFQDRMFYYQVYSSLFKNCCFLL